MRDSTLSNGDYSVADFAVSCDPNLPREDYIFSDISSSSQSNLRAEKRVRAHRAAVSHMDHVVKLRPARDASLADTRPVNTRIRLHFDVVFQNRRPRLDDLVPVAGVILRKAKPIAADYGSILEQNIVAKLAELANHSMRMREEVFANLHVPINHDVRQQHSVVANLGAFVNHDVRADVSILANLRRGMDDRRRMHPDGILRRLVEEFQRFRPCQVRILAAQHRPSDSREVLGNNDSGCFRRLGGGSIFGIGDEGKLPRASLFNAGDASDVDVSRTVLETSIQSRSNGN